MISIYDLIDDLENWSTLYCAGRLQKPVKFIRSDARVELAQQSNLRNALQVALLIHPSKDSKISESELYKTIARISYLGDFRMRVFGENPRKISNIVDSQFEDFRRLYSPIMNDIENVSRIGDDTIEVFFYQLFFCD